MVVLKVLAVVLGLAFLLFGYFIYFRKKYNLINGFEADFKAGRKNEEYAESGNGGVCRWNRYVDCRRCAYYFCLTTSSLPQCRGHCLFLY